jgi:MFS family permease
MAPVGSVAEAQVVSEAPIRRLWAAVLCGYLALGATLQELPGYLIGRFGSGPALAGLAVGLAFAATALVRPFAGAAGDAGRSRPVVMAGAGLTVLAGLGHLFAPGVGVLLVARLVMGAGEAALFSAALPWVLAGTPAGRGGRVAGWFGLSMWGGLALGPLLAVLAHRWGGSAAVWWLVAALPVVSGVLVASTRPPVRPARPAGPTHSAAPGLADSADSADSADPADSADRAGLADRAGFADPAGLADAARPAHRAGLRGWRELVPRGAGLPGLCLGLAAYGYGTLTALLVLYLGGQAIGGESVALTVYAAAFLLTRAAGSPLIDRYGGARVLRVVLCVEIVGLALLAAVPAESVALTGTALAGVGVGLVYPSAAAMTLHRAARSPGLAVGAMTSLWDLGILVAGPLGGLLAAHLGYRAAFAVAAGAGALALAVASHARAARSWA